MSQPDLETKGESPGAAGPHSSEAPWSRQHLHFGLSIKSSLVLCGIASRMGVIIQPQLPRI